METIDKLIEIAQYLGLLNIEKDIEKIRVRSLQENAPLVLPLVGEFSSGKTTLINALTDSKKLETATKPTTATIFEVHFGCERCHATVLNEKDEFVQVEAIAELKNDALADAKVVTVFDTSKSVPATTILVDTPGLSSPDPKHKQTLVNFLPKADGIILVTDINQQITRSLTDFIETMKLSMKPIFLVLTKSDTKSEAEIAAAKVYISDNCKIPVQQVAVVSAQKNSLEELLRLLDEIQKSKKDIIKRIDTQRAKNIANAMLEHIEQLMSASSSDKELDEGIRRCQYELDKISRNIDRLVESVTDDIQDCEREVSRKFEDIISSKLSGLVAGKSSNFDAEAVSMVNSTASLLISEYKTGVQRILGEKARSQKGTDEEVYLGSLNDVDLSGLQMTGLSYNLDLNTMGHEYDSWIKTGVIAVAAVGTVAAVAASGGAAGGALATVASADTVIDVVDTVTDVGSIISNQNTAGRIERAVGFGTQVAEKYNTMQSVNQQTAAQTGKEKGLIDSMVGLVTDNMMAKPQRARAVRNYVDNSLKPEFKSILESVSAQLLGDIREKLKSGAAQVVEQKQASLSQLKEEAREKKAVFEERMAQLREYKTILLTI